MKTYQKAMLALISFLSFCLLIGVNPSRLCLAQVSKDSVAYRLIWQKRFDEPISDVAFGLSLEGEVKIFPKIVVLKNRIEFYDQNFNLISTHPCLPNWFEATFSPNADYIVISTSTIRPTPERWGKRTLEILNAKGEKIGERETPWLYDELVPGILISNKGLTLESDAEKGILKFYTCDGQLLQQIKPFGDIGWDNGRSFKPSFSENGRYLAIGVCEHGPRPKGEEKFRSETEEEMKHLREKLGYFTATEGVSTNPWLIFYDLSSSETKWGEIEVPPKSIPTISINELWRYPLNDDYGGGVVTSPQGKYLVTSHYNFRHQLGERPVMAETTMLFARNGGVIKELPFELHSVTFSPNDKYVALFGKSTDGPGLKLIKCETGDLIWEQKGLKVAHVTIDSSGTVLLIASTGRPKLLLYSKDGVLVWKKPFISEMLEGKRISTQIMITPAGKKLMAVALKQRILCYRVKE